MTSLALAVLLFACNQSAPHCPEPQPLAELTYHIPDDAQSFGQNVRLVVRGDQAILHWTDEEGEHQMVYDIEGLD